MFNLSGRMLLPCASLLLLAGSVRIAQSASDQPTLKITAAYWGTEKHLVDVTDKVRAQVKNNSLVIRADTATFGDPTPYVRKELFVRFQLDGKESNLSVKENDTLTIGTPPPVPAAPKPSPKQPTVSEISVTSAPPTTQPLPPSTTPPDPTAIERPEYRDRPKPLLKSITTVTSMMVEEADDGEMTGLTSDIIATVPMESRRSGKSGIGFVSSDGDETMKVALNEAIRAVTLRYPIWEPGHIDLSFGEKFVKHGGPSAGAAFAVLTLSILEGYDIDPKCALTGDITVDWKIRKVGGVTAKVHGAAIDKCTLAVIPEGNEASFADMPLFYGTSALYNIQTFSSATLQDDIALARKDRDPKLTEAIKLFAGLQSQLTKNEKATLADPNTKTTLNKVLDLAPNHLSAKYLLAVAEGRAAKTLSAHGTFYRLDIIMYPFYEALASKHPLDRSTLPAATTINAKKKLNELRPICNKDLMPLLIDEAAFIEAMDQFADSPKSYSFSNLKTRAGNLDARWTQMAGDKDLRDSLRREGY